MPFKSAKCRLCYYQDTMLLPQSKISHFWSISTTSKYKKEILLFPKRDLPNSFPFAAWLVGLPSLLERKRHSNQRRGIHVPTHMLEVHSGASTFHLPTCVADALPGLPHLPVLMQDQFSASSHFPQS